MINSLSGKVALVTGGSRGIGAAIARRLAKDGAAVAFTYSNARGKAVALAAEIEGRGGKALAIQADSADAAAVQAAVTQTVEAFGRLDILVNNAGILLMGKIDTFSLEDFDRMIAVNVRPVFVGAQAAGRHMKDGGRIIVNDDEDQHERSLSVRWIGRHGWLIGWWKNDRRIGNRCAPLGHEESVLLLMAGLLNEDIHPHHPKQRRGHEGTQKKRRPEIRLMLRFAVQVHQANLPVDLRAGKSNPRCPMVGQMVWYLTEV